MNHTMLIFVICVNFAFPFVFATGENCSTSCIDYHPCCDDLEAGKDKCGLNISTRAHYYKFSCEDTFFIERCPRTCKQCIPCKMPDLSAIYAGINKLQNKLDQLSEQIESKADISKLNEINQQMSSKVEKLGEQIISKADTSKVDTQMTKLGDSLKSVSASLSKLPTQLESSMMVEVFRCDCMSPKKYCGELTECYKGWFPDRGVLNKRGDIPTKGKCLMSNNVYVTDWRKQDRRSFFKSDAELEALLDPSSALTIGFWIHGWSVIRKVLLELGPRDTGNYAVYNCPMQANERYDQNQPFNLRYCKLCSWIMDEDKHHVGDKIYAWADCRRVLAGGQYSDTQPFKMEDVAKTNRFKIIKQSGTAHICNVQFFAEENHY